MGTPQAIASSGTMPNGVLNHGTATTALLSASARQVAARDGARAARDGRHAVVGGERTQATGLRTAAQFLASVFCDHELWCRGRSASAAMVLPHSLRRRGRHHSRAPASACASVAAVGTGRAAGRRRRARRSGARGRRRGDDLERLVGAGGDDVAAGAEHDPVLGGQALGGGPCPSTCSVSPMPSAAMFSGRPARPSSTPRRSAAIRTSSSARTMFRRLGAPGARSSRAKSGMCGRSSFGIGCGPASTRGARSPARARRARPGGVVAALSRRTRRRGAPAPRPARRRATTFCPRRRPRAQHGERLACSEHHRDSHRLPISSNRSFQSARKRSSP